MLNLVLVRHGETRWNEERRVQGSGSDPQLNPTGRTQAERVAQALRGRMVDAIYSSPLQRAWNTAQAVAGPHRISVEVDMGLREIDAGDFEGRTVESLGGALSQFLIVGSGGRMPKLPGGEGLNELQLRAWASVEHILGSHHTGRVVVVSHYFTILSIVCRALGFPLATLRRLRVSPGSISVVGFTERGPILLSLNDTCHLS
ncbi:MAG: histidine phosphatase family protein [Chloroflexota bacterium]